MRLVISPQQWRWVVGAEKCFICEIMRSYLLLYFLSIDKELAVGFTLTVMDTTEGAMDQQVMSPAAVEKAPQEMESDVLQQVIIILHGFTFSV